jgi:LacI family transcriptional regulator
MAGVSQITVSRVLRGSNKVSKKLRQKVLEASQRTGYRPRGDARAMRRGRFDRIAIVVPRYGLREEGRPGYFGYVDTAASELADLDYSMIFEPLCLNPETDDFYGFPKLFTEIAADGVLVVNPGVVPPVLPQRLKAMGCPIVWLNQKPDDGEIAVWTDEIQNARILTRHLLELGHRRIGYMWCGHGDHYSMRERKEGYVLELKERGLAPCGMQEHPGDDWAEQARWILDQNPRPTAVICYYRALYDLLLHESARRGIRVPEDLSLCLFASTWESSPLRPFTCLAVPEAEMAKQGARCLVELIREGSISEPMEPLVGKLYPGGTTARASEE